MHNTQLDDIDTQLYVLNAELHHLHTQYGVLMNSIADALKVAAKSAPPKFAIATVTKGSYRHVVRYNINDPTERTAVGTRITECISNGYKVSTQECRK